MNTRSKTQYQVTVAAPLCPPSVSPGLAVTNVNLVLAGKPILRNIEFTLAQTGMTTLIGPSGAGKSSLLRCLNLLHHDWEGAIHFHGRDIRRWPDGDDALRRQIALIAQKPTVFPCSIRRNVLFGLRRHESKQTPSGFVEHCLRQAALWDEVADRLDDVADTLSIGQQQRLCLARALALGPALLLLDEPTASLDPRSKGMIEHSLQTLAQDMPVLCVTHDLEQTRRLGGQVIFMCDGRVIEKNAAAADFFNHPQRIESREFLRWSVCDCD